ncbi:MAG: autotransporter outer membrane beta-barrel domain-containing protein, partial [Alphaproteobacteria bacterium]|nr:autotransporter outer membrane beta-barrel domain-containing protein [Alphaproteobacteria bacterium]
RAKVYIKGLYDRTKSSMGEGFRARSKGAVLGVQSEVTEDLTLGVGYATSQTTAKEDLRRTEVDTNTGFVSAHYQPNAWWVSGLATFSRGEYEEEKQILSSMGKATYDVDSWGAQVMTGYDIKLETAIITPEVGLRYLSVKQEGYTDTLGTTVSGTRSDYLTALVGVKGTWNMGAIRPTAGVTVGYDVISDDVSALNTLANGASYTVNGEALDRLSTTVTTGIEADLGERTTLKLEYSGTFRKEYTDHSGMLRLEFKF